MSVTTRKRRQLGHLSPIIHQYADQKLSAPRNLEKGDNWETYRWDYLRQRTHEEVDELFDKLEAGVSTNQDYIEVWEEAADVENFMRMGLDKGGFFTSRMRGLRNPEERIDNGS